MSLNLGILALVVKEVLYDALEIHKAIIYRHKVLPSNMTAVVPFAKDGRFNRQGVRINIR